ncbi:transposase, partial [Pleurocapsales cyanobacterium LEGE 06147]|nr:transposase [Pleurocapsales cyanobacterium LEGE 06147]
LLPTLKKENEWLKEPYSQTLQSACLNLSNAFVNFFEKRGGYPRFKSKHHRQSIQYKQNVKVEGDYLKVPKLGLVVARIHRQLEGKLKTVTISKNPDDKYFASLLFDDGVVEPEQSTEGKAIGIDLGLTDFCVTSAGSKYKQPKWLRRYEKNLKRKQKKLSRKVKGSKNRDKARLKVAKVQSKISRCREDFLHKLSRKIVNDNQVVCLESLHVKGIVRNPNLSKAISQVGWGQFCTMLKYKAEQEGKVYLEVDRWFPSSKTCNICLNVVGSLPLDIRAWTCNTCNTHHDRDINAAINIMNEGLRILSLGSRDTASGGEVRPKSGRKKSTTRLPCAKLEAYAYS